MKMSTRFYLATVKNDRGFTIGVSRAGSWTFQAYEQVTAQMKLLGAGQPLVSMPRWERFLGNLPRGLSVFNEAGENISVEVLLLRIRKERDCPCDIEGHGWFYENYFRDLWGYTFSRSEIT
jgi:hypothetical protein